MIIRHFARLPAGLVALWCFLLWYVAMLFFYFEASLRLWGNALGMSLIIGSVLLLNIPHGGGPAREFWRSFRLFMIPFCVSSFSALVRDDGFYAILSPKLHENIVASLLCMAFIGWIALARLLDRRKTG